MVQILSNRAVANHVNVLRCTCTWQLLLDAISCAAWRFGGGGGVLASVSIWSGGRENLTKRRILILQLVHDWARPNRLSEWITHSSLSSQMFHSSLETCSIAWNVIPCSVLELVRFLMWSALLLFPVSAKRGNVHRLLYPQNGSGENLPAFLETRSFW